MENQKHLFNLPADIHYINGAYMSPNLKEVEKAGIEGVKSKSNPIGLQEADFFEPAIEVRKLFGELINAPSERIALIPSASYGLANAINNVPFTKGQYAVTVSDEFPSDHLTLKAWCDENQAELKAIAHPEELENRATLWTQKILDAITSESAMVVMSSVHWMEGTLFDLEAIGKKCKATDTYFIVDGTQSVGALPIDVKKFNIDALVCAAYKWLLGPYQAGAAFYNEKFDNGKPLEESWLTRKGSNDFSRLSLATEEYGEAAMRYNVGEFGNFIALPMLKQALKQLIAWDPARVQEYCRELVKPVDEFLIEKNFEKDHLSNVSCHLMGIHLPDSLDKKKLMADLKSKKIYVSIRGNILRVSPHVYNTKEDIDAFLNTFKNYF